MIRFIEFRAMNTRVMLAAEGELDVEGMQAAKSFIDECEQRFSRFLPASEVTELNRSAGEWFKVSHDLMEMLQLSLKYHHETHGMFDPTILADLKRVGYDRSMDEIRENGAAKIRSASERTDQHLFTEINFDLTRGRVRLPRGLEVDLNGVAKAWIVERAARLLHQFVDVCGVSAGGDMLFIGQPSDGMDWDIFLEEPQNPARMLAQLHVAAGAVATSSITKRSWVQGQHVRHHIIDPRSGEPAETEWSSVTVIGPNLVEADVYAKAILIGGQATAHSILQMHPEITFIAVDTAGNLAGSPNYKDYLYEPETDIFVSNGIDSQTHR